MTTAGAEIDAAKRKALYSQLNSLVLDESFILILAGLPQTVAASAKVRGFDWWMHEGRNYQDTWLAQ